MLANLIEKGRYSFHEGFDNWEDAIREAVKPLEKTGAVDETYASRIIENVHKFGPYIVIAPDICIPHAQEGGGVNETSISFMKTEKPVNFGPEALYEASVFFTLASVNNDEHLKNLMELMSLLEDEDKIKKLSEVKNIKDLEALI